MESRQKVNNPAPDGKNRQQTISDICFWLGIFCELAVSFSGYAYGNYKEPVIIIAGMAFFSIKIILTMDLKKDWPVFAVLGIYGILCYYNQGSALILRIALLWLAARDKDAREITRVFFLGTLAVMVVTGILSAFGLHGALYLTQKFRHEEETRFCFGFFNPNGFAVFAFKVFVLGLYSYQDSLKWWQYLLAVAAAVPFLLLAGSKTGLAALAVSILCILLLLLIRKKEVLDKIFYGIGNLVLGGEVMMLILVLFYMKYLRTWEIAGINLWKAIDRLTTGRLRDARILFWEQAPALFGQKTVEGATEIGYFNSLYHEGVLFVLLYLVLVFCFYYRLYKQQDLMGMLLVTGISIYCFGEAFLPYINKNVILLVMAGNLPVLEGFAGGQKGKKAAK